jgi:RNA polymerase sigma-70 factor (ECF subfamily)
MRRVDALSKLSEDDLVRRLKATGDGRIFEELYRRSRRRVFGVCFRILGDAAAAEDACHDAFVRAYQCLDSLRGTSFTAWVRRIATNCSYDELRRRRPEELTEAVPGPVAGDQVEASAISRQELDRAIALIGSLEPHQRRVFLLRHLDCRSYGEIQHSTGFTAKQVKSYLQNARRNFHLAWQRGSEGVDHE